MNNETVGITFDVPNGLMDAYNVSITIDASVVVTVTETNSPYFTPNATVSWNYTDGAVLKPCAEFTINITTRSGCGNDLDPLWSMSYLTQSSYLCMIMLLIQFVHNLLIVSVQLPTYHP